MLNFNWLYCFFLWVAWIRNLPCFWSEIFMCLWNRFMPLSCFCAAINQKVLECSFLSRKEMNCPFSLPFSCHTSVIQAPDRTFAPAVPFVCKACLSPLSCWLSLLGQVQLGCYFIREAVSGSTSLHLTFFCYFLSEPLSLFLACIPIEIISFISVF